MTYEKKQNLTLHYSFLHGSYWSSCASMSFISAYLLSHHFQNTAIGLLVATAGILAAILQPAIAAYADRPTS